MALDLKLPSNEIMLFTFDLVVMTERNQLPGLMDALSPFLAKSPFSKRTSGRYDLKEFMTAGQTDFNSTARATPSKRLDSGAL